MNDVENCIERAYREAVATLPYSKISVKLLCDHAHISRKAFYKRFHGKGDVLSFIFWRDIVKPQVELCQLLSFKKMGDYAVNMEQRMFESVLSDGSFYRAVAMSPQGGRDAFSSAISAVLCDFNIMLLEEYGFAGSPLEKDYVASCYADAKTQVMLKWIVEDYPLTADQISELYSRMALPFWNDVMKA